MGHPPSELQGKAKPWPRPGVGASPQLPPRCGGRNQAQGSLFLLCTAGHPFPLHGDPSLCFFPPQPALYLAMAAPLAAAAKLRVHVRVWFPAGGPRPADGEAGVHQPQEAVSAGRGGRGPGRVSDMPLPPPHPWGWRVGRGLRRSRKQRRVPFGAFGAYAEKQGGDRHTDRLVTSNPQWPPERKRGLAESPPQERKHSPCFGAMGPLVPQVLPCKNCLS